MPRKPGIGPPILKLELLSSGIDPRLVDDFTLQPIPQPSVKAPSVQSAQDHRDANNRDRAAAQRALLEHLGMLPSQPKLMAPAVQGMRAVGTIGGKAVMVQMPGWRRV